MEKAKTGEKPFIIYVDANQNGLGAAFCQNGDDHRFIHPVYFAQESYRVTDLHALAIVFALRKFQFSVSFGFYVQECNVVVEYVKGKTNVAADALSRSVTSRACEESASDGEDEGVVRQANWKVRTSG
ncbi:unnamed protein product [Heligmosomoides polygyrus]|uniref:RT_RNaseH_2 domain-containing protein n=1 Tax=Heligmosomoides polygyrus TaxID=6339 RepID=A0A183G8L4_HELPZ|nr:unnamed protein product [Heligmosomoides polygyrus]